MIDIQKTVNFDELGDRFAGSYINFSEPSAEDVMKLASNDLETLKSFLDRNFIEGKIFDNGQEIILTKENINKLPISLFQKVAAFLVGRS